MKSTREAIGTLTGYTGSRSRHATPTDPIDVILRAARAPDAVAPESAMVERIALLGRSHF
jgi:hypothetical protein